MSDFFISLGFMKPLLFLKADSVVAFGFALLTIGGFTASDTIVSLVLLARPSPEDLLRGVIVLPRLTRRVTFGFLLVL